MSNRNPSRPRNPAVTEDNDEDEVYHQSSLFSSAADHYDEGANTEDNDDDENRDDDEEEDADDDGNDNTNNNSMNEDEEDGSAGDDDDDGGGNDTDSSNDYFPYSVRQLLDTFSSSSFGPSATLSSMSSSSFSTMDTLPLLQERLRLRNLLFSWICQNCTVTQPLRLRKLRTITTAEDIITDTASTTKKTDSLALPPPTSTSALNEENTTTGSVTSTVATDQRKHLIEHETSLHYEIEAYVKAIQTRLKNMTVYHNAKTLYHQQLLSWRAHRLAYEANVLQDEDSTRASNIRHGMDSTEGGGSNIASSFASSSSHHHHMDITRTENRTHITSNVHLHMDIDTTSRDTSTSTSTDHHPSLLPHPHSSSSSSSGSHGIPKPGPPPSPPDYASILATLPPVPSLAPTVPLSILQRQKCSNCGCTYIVPSESANKLLHEAHLQVEAEVEDEDNSALGDAVAIMQTGANDMSETNKNQETKQETMDVLLPYNVNMDILRNTIDMDNEELDDYLAYTGLTMEKIHDILRGDPTATETKDNPHSTPSSKAVPTLHEQISTPDPLTETYRQGYAGFSPTTALAYDDRMLAHEEVKRPSNRQKNSLQFSLPGVNLPVRTVSPHPERPDRLRSIAQHLVTMGLFQRCKRIPAREITDDELRFVHTPTLLNNVNTLPQFIRDNHGEYVYDTGDTFANPYTQLAARLSCGSVVAVTEAVIKGKTDRGITLVRPPGHHAEPDHCMGFCLYNNVGVAAAIAKERYGIKRILIVDWDVHHGNGTENMFYDDPSVLFISLHRYDYGNFYPGTGHADRTGKGDGEGYNVNIPWNSGNVGDIEYATAFDEIIMPIAYAYNPELVLVSSGFDAARGDPLGGCDLTPNGYAYMTHRLLALAQGKVVVVLEGGYNLQSISRGMEAVLRTLLGQSPPNLLSIPSRVHRKVDGVAAELAGEQGHVLHNLGNKWKSSSGTRPDSGPTPNTEEGTDDEEDKYLDDYYSGQNREEILTDIAPQPSVVDTIAEVLRIQSRYWPSLRIKYRAYAQIAEETLRAKMKKEQELERERSVSLASSSGVGERGKDTEWGAYNGKNNGKPDYSTLMAVLKGEKTVNTNHPMSNRSSSNNGTENSSNEEEEEDIEEDDDDELPPLVPNPTKKPRN